MTNKHILVLVGASAGGGSALPELIRQITDDMRVSVMVVLHLSKMSIGELLVRRLQKTTAMKCKIPQHGEMIKERHVYVAMPDHHMLVKGKTILLGRGPMENRYRPSIDALFRSGAVAFNSGVIAIILSGLLDDGAVGMNAVKECGGICIVQDPAEARYPDMPRAVLNVLKPHFMARLPEMGNTIRESIGMLKKKGRKKVPPDILKEAIIAERVNTGIAQVEGLGKLSAISCPDCGGSLWEMNASGLARYRCHVGHAFSEEGLLGNMESSAETTLWVALRMMEERKNLLKQISDRESQRGNKRLAQTYSKRLKELESHAKNLKNILFSVSGDPR